MLDTKISFLADRRPERVVGGGRLERRRQLRKKGGLGGGAQPRRGRVELVANTLTPPLQVKLELRW